jgi:glucose uptake protein
MLGIICAVVTVVAWGSWLAPSQNVPLKNQQIKIFYVATTNLVVAFLFSLSHGLNRLTLDQFWPPFVGGLIWAVSGLCAFVATNRLGMAKACGLWSPLNIIVSLICGWFLFDEFRHVATWVQAMLVATVGLIIGGVLLIVFAKGEARAKSEGNAWTIGLLSAVAAGVLWGIYFIPIKMSRMSLWIAAFPMAVGIFVGSAFLMAIAGQSPRLSRGSDYVRLGATAVLWTAGNYGMLLLVDQLGAGKGFTIAQLSVVVNALIGIYGLKDPPPKTRAARMVLLGCILATSGGILLGNLDK